MIGQRPHISLGEIRVGSVQVTLGMSVCLSGWWSQITVENTYRLIWISLPINIFEYFRLNFLNLTRIYSAKNKLHGFRTSSHCNFWYFPHKGTIEDKQLKFGTYQSVKTDTVCTGPPGTSHTD